MHKLKLEHPTVNDGKEIFELVAQNRQRFNKWFDWVDEVQTVQDEIDFIDESIVSNNRELYCIKIENTIVGMIDLHRINSIDKSAELGYWIDSTYEGLGIVSNIIANLELYIPDIPNVERLKITVNHNNIKSINVAQRANFEFIYAGNQKIVYQKAFI